MYTPHIRWFRVAEKATAQSVQSIKKYHPVWKNYILAAFMAKP